MTELQKWLSSLFELAEDRKANFMYRKMRAQIPDWLTMDIKGDNGNYLITREAVGKEITIKKY